MRARALLFVASLATSALAGDARSSDPKPKPVDIKDMKDKLQLLEDAHGGTYVIYMPGKVGDARIFYTSGGKQVYEQIVVTRSQDGGAGTWDLGSWAPRQSGLSPASVRKEADGTFKRWCGETESALKLVPADRAKGMIEKLELKTTALTRRPQLFARDDAGVYYYVDHLSKDYGGSGYRVFSGKKGAMKELPLTDVAIDTAGEVYSTKSGDVRFVKDASGQEAFWIKGEKKTKLSVLDPDVNSKIIWSELGIYTFVGTMCDEL